MEGRTKFGAISSELGFDHICGDLDHISAGLPFVGSKKLGPISTTVGWVLTTKWTGVGLDRIWSVPGSGCRRRVEIVVFRLLRLPGFTLSARKVRVGVRVRPIASGPEVSDTDPELVAGGVLHTWPRVPAARAFFRPIGRHVTRRRSGILRRRDRRGARSSAANARTHGDS